MSILNTNDIFADRYYVLNLLGTGGMAEVYKGYDLVLDHPVAIKVLLPEYATDTAFTNRFLSEAQSASKASNLDKLHTVGVLDWGFSNDRCYIVMEYVDGVDLKRLLVEFGAFSPYETARIADQVCSALQSAHAYGIIHRDIKPSNVLLKRSTGDVKVTDFGIALANRADNQGINSVAGTVQYMSPEQARGDQVTYASDIYSLGVTMYEMCCEVLPFESDEILEAARTGKLLTPDAPCDINPSVDQEFSDIILSCMQADPQRRLSTARNTKSVLKAYMSNHAEDNLPVQTHVAQCWYVVFVAQGMQKHKGYTIERPTVVGRGSQSDIQIASNAISRMHARLTPEGTFLRVEDLGSTNGTLVNGEPVLKSARCFPGDTITIGPTNLRVVCRR